MKPFVVGIIADMIVSLKSAQKSIRPAILGHTQGARGEFRILLGEGEDQLKAIRSSKLISNPVC